MPLSARSQQIVASSIMCAAMAEVDHNAPISRTGVYVAPLNSINHKYNNKGLVVQLMGPQGFNQSHFIAVSWDRCSLWNRLTCRFGIFTA